MRTCYRRSAGATGADGKHERVFIDPKTNLPLTVSNDIYTAWREIIRKAQVRYRRPYQCRHTYASTMLTAGANHRWLADQLGHEDVATLFAHYGKFIPENTRRSVDDVVANALSSWESAARPRTVDALVDAAESHQIHTDDENE